MKPKAIKLIPNCTKWSTEVEGFKPVLFTACFKLAFCELKTKPGRDAHRHRGIFRDTTLSLWLNPFQGNRIFQQIYI